MHTGLVLFFIMTLMKIQTIHIGHASLTSTIVDAPSLWMEAISHQDKHDKDQMETKTILLYEGFTLRSHLAFIAVL